MAIRPTEMLELISHQGSAAQSHDESASHPLCCRRPAAKACPTLVTPWTAARQASPSLTTSWTLPKFMSIQSVVPSNPLILRHTY